VSARRPPVEAAAPLQVDAPTRTSYARLAITDSVAALGALGIVSCVFGMFDDRGDSLLLGLTGVVALGSGLVSRRTFSRNIRPAPGRVLSGLALSWIVLVLLGTGVYLATGTIGRVDDALVEAAAGFSTTSVTTLDPGELNVPMQIWRAATQWLGGLLGIVAGVIALPLAFRGRYLAVNSTQQNPDRLAPNPAVGRQRVGTVYLALTVALGIAYALVGLGTRDSVVHAMTTISTGGFSSQADSFSGFGTGARTVATVGMIIGGSSFFVIWWIVRGRLTPVWRSTELRLYLGLLAVGSTLFALDADDIGVGDAIFTTASALSTTGFAVGDWTAVNDALLTVLLVIIGTGSMSGSAGGGLRVIRAWMLVGFASRELRRQLDPHSIVVVKQGGVAIDEPTLERNTGYQIGHLGLCAAAAFLLAAGGLDVTGAIYTGVSVISTHGPGVGVGPYGDISDWSPVGRLLLTPFMLAGRLSILPLLLGVSTLFATEKAILRLGRRIAAKAWRR
jgi:trk system potassium uptake protein TrkH